MSLTQAYLREILDYDPASGKLSNKVARARARVGVEPGAISENNCGKLYRIMGIKGKTYRVHRIIWFWMTGEFPLQIDHANGNGLDNRWVNLSAATPTSNRRNTRRPKNNTSGHIGITWVKAERKWRARIMLQRKNRFLGLFTRFEDAVAARKAADKEFGFHPNHGQDRPL